MMFPVNNRRPLGSGQSRSAAVPTFQPSNSDTSMGASRDRMQENYKPNAGYQPPAIGPTNPMTPSGSVPGASNPMGMGTPGMKGPGMGMPPMPNPMRNPLPNPFKAPIPNNMQPTPDPFSAGIPGGGPMNSPIAPSPEMMGSFSDHRNRTTPMMNNTIQQNASRISQGVPSGRVSGGGLIDSSRRVDGGGLQNSGYAPQDQQLEFMGQPVNLGQSEGPDPIKRNRQY